MSLLIPLTVAVPLLVAALLVASSKLISRRIADFVAVLTAVSVAVMSCLLLLNSLSAPIVYWFGNWLPRGNVAIGICFVVDPFSGSFATLVGLLFASALMVSWHYFESIGTLFHALMLVFLGALTGFCLTGDIFTLFVCFELMSVAAYALTAYKIEESSLEGAINFAVTNTIGGFMLLLGLGLLYGDTGALNLAQISRTLAGHSASGLITVAFLLISCGLFTKAAIVPFHFWLDDAHAVAPTPVCVPFSGIMVESALYAVARIYWTVFSGPLGPHMHKVRAVLLAVAILTSVLGAVLCLAQRHIKRMLAFSTISHSGLILVGVSLFDVRSLAGAGVYLIGHGLVKATLFICAGILLHRISTVDELNLWGKARHLRWTALLTVVGALALCGIPPFATFSGKALIDEAAVHQSYSWLPWVLSITTALTAATVLRMAARVFWGIGTREGGIEARSPTEQDGSETNGFHQHTPFPMLVPAALLLVGCIVIAYLPGFTEHAVASARSFENSRAYSDIVLKGTFKLTPHITRSVEPSSHSFLYAFASLIIAAGVCAVSLLPMPDSMRKGLARYSDPCVNGLRYLHSGHVGDYVFWQMLGLAVIGLAIAIVTR